MFEKRILPFNVLYRTLSYLFLRTSMAVDSMVAWTFQTPTHQLKHEDIHYFSFFTLLTICKIIIQITIDSIPNMVLYE